MDDSDDKFEDADEEDYFANIASDARFDNKWRRNASIDQENSSEFQSGSNPCHDQASTMVMKNDDDDDEMDIGNNMQEETDHTSATANEVVFDEKKFFSAPTFPARVLEESKYMIYERIEEPLSRLESDDGPEIFLKHCQEHIHKADMDEEEERRLHQQNLDDLLVQGDPREYQRHLLEIALQKNTIVNLGTGTGKTLIALLCIKEIREADKDHKQTLFLVPSVALAIQHGLTLQSNLPNFRVESAYYERSGSQKAREKLVSCDIIVATHGAILDMLMHYGDMFSFDRFNLIVIDECHYACGKHPYRHLMMKFYHTLPPGERPHILGLTASPLISISEHHTDDQLSGLLDSLEKTLDATLVSASGMYNASPNVRTIEEEVLGYQSTNTGRSIPPARNWTLLPSRYREFKQLEYLYKEVGPLVLRIYCQVVRLELSRNFFESETKEQFASAKDYLKIVEEYCDQEVSTLPAMGRTDKLLALEELVEALIENKQGKRAIGLVFVERRITAMALHCYFTRKRDVLVTKPNWEDASEARRSLKETKLVTTESSNHDSNDMFEDSTDDPLNCHSSVVGTKRKMEQMNTSPRKEKDGISAKVSGEGEDVQKRLRRRETGRVHSVALVRNPTQIFNSLSLAQQKLNESELLKRKKIWVHKEMNIRDTLSDLRSGSTNLLFATSLVEEGVDVQACSFVVAFDGINSVKGYVQMKGRARQEDAKFFLLQDAIIEQKSQLNLSTARKMELRIQSIIEQRMKTNDSTVATARHKQSIDARALSESKELAAIEAGMYKVGEAVVDLHTAKSLLHRYYVSLPVEDLVRRKKSLLLAYLPAFDKDRLELPSHFPHAARTIVTPEKYKGLSRKEKEQILSLMAVVRLHCNGLLNDRLLPLTRKDMHDRILALMSEDGKGNDKIPRVLRFGNSFEATQAFHVYPLIQRGHLLSLFESQLKGDGHTLGLLSVDPISFSPATVNHREFGQMTLSLGEPTVFVCTPERCIILQKIFSILFNHRWSRRSQNIFYTFREESDFLTPIQPYFIGILSSTLKLDFDLMNCIISEAERNTQQRKDAASDTATRKEMPKPRIWSPTYSEFRQYVVVGPSGKTCREKFPNLIDGVESFSDYYQKKYGHVVQDDEPLFEARYLWTSYSSLQLDPGKVVDQPLHAPVFHSILLPPSLCFEAPLANGHIALLSLFLPQILFLFERNLIAEAFLRHCEHEAPKMFSYCRKVSIEKVVTILTAKSCNRDDNYDTCEWLGDAVLKLLLSDSLIKSRRQKDFVEFLHEGDLSMLRSVMGSNERLSKVCAKFGFEKFLMTAPLSRGKWIPSPLRRRDSDIPDQASSELRRKTMADVMEALLGLIYLEFGYGACREVGLELGVSLDFGDKENFAADTTTSADLENVIRACTDYQKIRCPRVLEQAFTHPSAIHTNVSSYQRLEWIGDAVVCLCIREWLLRNCTNDLGLKDLVMIEDALVSNETLALLSMKHRLPHFLNHRDQTLPGRMEAYYWRVQSGSGLWNTDPPKTVSDVAESILGAVHVDGGFCAGQAAAQKFFGPVFEIVKGAATDNGSLIRILKHPKRALQEMTGELLDLTSLNEATFAATFPDWNRVLYSERWERPMDEGTSHVSAVTILDSPVVAVADESLSISKNQACLLFLKALEDNSNLALRLARCQSKIASATTSSIIGEGSREESDDDQPDEEG